MAIADARMTLLNLPSDPLLELALHRHGKVTLQFLGALLPKRERGAEHMTFWFVPSNPAVCISRFCLPGKYYLIRFTREVVPKIRICGGTEYRAPATIRRRSSARERSRSSNSPIGGPGGAECQVLHDRPTGRRTVRQQYRTFDIQWHKLTALAQVRVELV
jgi:hypothetical protein